MVKIVITGNMGYIGPAVIRQLRRSYPDARLIGVDMGYFSHCLTAVDMLPECRVDAQYFADVRRPLTDEILHGCDAVVHLAAISNDPMGKCFEDVTHQVNYRASVQVAQQAKAAGARAFVFASSCSVYGAAEGGDRFGARGGGGLPGTVVVRQPLEQFEFAAAHAADGGVADEFLVAIVQQARQGGIGVG